ncbi:MAG: response regulator transcription factor [Fluviicola sp.]|nr:response regulator transcription factor [Fluviicola sp.]
MNTIRAILADDEESARDVLENLLLRFCPDVELLGKYENVIDCVEAVKELQPDLLFLDIEMPNYAGYEIVNFFDKIDFEIIFVTAYDKYAVRAFEVSALDYLLKPIDVDRLKFSIDKVHKRLDIKEPVDRFSLLKKSLKEKSISSMIITDKGYQHIVDLESIIAIEAQESYSIIHTKDKIYTASKNLKHFEKLLVENSQFFRVHKSWMVNLDFLDSYSKSKLDVLMSNGLTTKLSKYKKAEFEAALVAK